MKRVMPLASLVAIGCGLGNPMIADTGVCEGYPEPATANYVLPYPAGITYKVTQTNCRPITHWGILRFGYDFNMPEGSAIHAMRSGTVVEVNADNPTNTGDSNNPCMGLFVKIRHVDGSHARYLHFRAIDSTTVLNASITQGDKLGDSGQTGCTGNFPHLHVDITVDPILVKTVPLSFRNAGQRSGRPLIEQDYTAQAFTPDNN